MLLICSCFTHLVLVVAFPNHAAGGPVEYLDRALNYDWYFDSVTELPPGSDVHTEPITLPTPVSFYGDIYDSVVVNRISSLCVCGGGGGDLVAVEAGVRGWRQQH